MQDSRNKGTQLIQKAEGEDEGEEGISGQAILPPLPSCPAHAGQVRKLELFWSREGAKQALPEGFILEEALVLTSPGRRLGEGVRSEITLTP